MHDNLVNHVDSHNSVLRLFIPNISRKVLILVWNQYQSLADQFSTGQCRSGRSSQRRIPQNEDGDEESKEVEDRKKMKRQGRG